MTSGGRFTGEFFVPGKSGSRIEADHVERYRFAAPWARGRVVLDVACGAGYGTKMLATRGAIEVVGVDLSSDALDIAVEYYEGPARFELGDITQYGATAAFDLVTCFETIEHVKDAEAALRNLRRVLRQGGLLVISSPNRSVTSPRATKLDDPPLSPFHVREYRPGELRRDLEACGFAVSAAVFGQRFEPRLPRLPAAVWRRLFAPHERADPAVRRVPRWATPRYFVLTAR